MRIWKLKACQGGLEIIMPPNFILYEYEEHEEQEEGYLVSKQFHVFSYYLMKNN